MKWVPGMVILALLCTNLSVLGFNLEWVDASGKILVGRQGDWETIQQGINSADPGDTIMVQSGIYREHVIVNKTVSLVGENSTSTIVDGMGDIIPVVRIVASNVNMSGFTIQNTTDTQPGYGVYLRFTENVTVKNVMIRKCWHGLCIGNSTACRISGSRIVSNYEAGVYLPLGSKDNRGINNWIGSNQLKIWIGRPSCKNNIFYHNNLVNNTNQFTSSGEGTW